MNVPRLEVPLPSQITHPNRSLQHPAVAVVIAGIALLLLASLVVTYRRRRPPAVAGGHEPGPDDWGPRAGPDLDCPAILRRTRSCLSLALVLLAGLAGVNSYAGYVPNMTALASLLGGGNTIGAVQRVTIPSAIPGTGNRNAYVYLPPGYDTPGRRYPVLYLIHGNPGTAIDYFRSGLAADTATTMLAKRQAQPVILVAMQMASSVTEDSECLDATGGVQETRYLLETVIPFVDQQYRTVATRGSRGIAGFSSGAFCALDIGLHHQDRFTVIAAEQPYPDPGADVNRRALHDDPTRVADHDLPRYLRTAVVHPDLHVWLDAPVDDETGPAARALSTALAARGTDVSLRLQAKDRHSWVAVQDGFPDVLQWATGHLRAG